VAASVTFSGPGNASVGGSGPARAIVLTRTVHGATFLVAVRVPGAGLITIAGAAIRTLSRRVSGAGAYRLRVTLLPSARRALARTHRLRLALRVTDHPAGATATAASVALTVISPLNHRRPARARRASSGSTGGAR
jgi:hypothetical protein